MSDWITITNFNHTKNGFGDNYFIRNNEDGTQTYFKDDLSQFSDNEVKLLLENDVPNKFTNNLNQQGGAKTGYLTVEGFEAGIRNITLGNDIDEEVKGNYIYDNYDWSYTTSTKGADLLTRYLYNLFIPSMFKNIIFSHDPIWKPLYNAGNKKMKEFDNKISIDNVINLYFKIPDNKKIMKIDDTTENRAAINNILTSRLSTKENAGKQKKIMYLLQKNVSCINTFCYRVAVSGGQPGQIKMRQECTNCKGREDDTSTVNGYGFEIRNDGKTYISKDDVKFVCPRFCVNSKIKVNTQTWTNDGTRDEPIIYQNKLDPNDTGPLKDKFGNPMFCPISWTKYKNLVTGVYEIDHKNGNHWDNSSMNVQSLCKICHETKSSLSSDKAKDLPGSPISITVLLQQEVDEIEKNENILIDEVLKRVNKYRQFCLDNDLDSNEIFIINIDYAKELQDFKDLVTAKTTTTITKTKTKTKFAMSVTDIQKIIKRIGIEDEFDFTKFKTADDKDAPTKLKDALITYLESK